jgi:enoyl-CoA hydratase/carnithine racemase
MAGSVSFEIDGPLAHVVLANPGKHNAIDIAMWRELRSVFERLQALPADAAPRAVIVAGANGQFASGGDIHEFAGFRFEEDKLRAFHEQLVAPALHAMLACEIVLYAQIDGACVGGGLEIAACCDIRICGESSRFGAPIARLGFPMAPLELQIVQRVAGDATLREMLLEARLIDASHALRVGLMHAVQPDAQLAHDVRRRALQTATLSPQAARLNKRTLRRLADGALNEAQRRDLYAYAASAEHVEGVTAFIEKRAPRFDAH